MEKARLGRGELRAKVSAALETRPGESLTPSLVALYLGSKSIGAVANALQKLTADTESGITLVQERPRRYSYRPAATDEECDDCLPDPLDGVILAQNRATSGADRAPDAGVTS